MLQRLKPPEPMLIYAKNLNRGPINSKLSEALRSGFLGLRGGRHAVEQLHLARSRQGPHLACSKKTRPEWAIIVLKT